MSPRSIQLRLGVAACLISLVLGFIGIPFGVSSPSNVSNIVLSPTFWPYALTGFTGLTGIGLILVGWRSKATESTDEESSDNYASWLRLGLLALIMIFTMVALPRLGMVWTTMLVFVVTAFLFKTRHPLTAIVCAIVIPLVLYVFFAHVAGVGIPQGNFVRLP